MMRKLLAIASLLLFTGCGYNFGLVYENVRQPPIQLVVVSGPPTQLIVQTDPNLNSAAEGRAIRKSGRACSHDFMKLFAWGDSSQATAALEGGVRTVTTVDFEVTAILGLVYTEVCTIVSGT